ILHGSWGETAPSRARWRWPARPASGSRNAHDNGGMQMNPAIRTAVACAVLSAAIGSLSGCGRQAPVTGNPAAACAGLFGNRAFPGMQVTGVTYLAAEASLPERCEVQGIIRPEPGSEIGVVYRLPRDWNGKLLALGGGGWM